MNTDQKAKIYAFLQDQISNADFRVKANIFDEHNHRRLGRNAFVRLAGYIRSFQAGNRSVRWITMYGLRGAGKTTLLSQLYDQTKVENRRRLFLSVDQVTEVFGASLKDVLEIYEEILGSSFEQLAEPVFLFLDEVQYDKKWGVLLKTVYDRSKNVFIMATGSSALALQASTDVARRSILEKLHPMSFSEFIKIKNRKTEIKGLGLEVRQAMFNAKNAKGVYEALQTLSAKVKQYWIETDPRDVERYMRFGSLPFMVSLNNEALVYDQIKKTLERVVGTDIPQIAQFSADTVSKIPMVLYAISESEQLSTSSLSKNMAISRPVLAHILDTLERTETIWRVFPHGSHMLQTRQPSKYLFTSPAFRSMYFNFIGNTRSKDTYKGKLLEDTIGLYLRRLFAGRTDTAITYDSAAGGADFIVRYRSAVYVIEVGFGAKSPAQVEHTMQKPGVRARYGIVISEGPLTVNEKKNIVSIPLQYFLLA